MKPNCRVQTRALFKSLKLSYQDIFQKDVDELFTLLKSVLPCSFEAQYIVKEGKVGHLQRITFSDSCLEDLVCFEIGGFISICPNQPEEIADRICEKMQNWMNGLAYEKQKKKVRLHEEIRSIESSPKQDRLHKERVQDSRKRLGRGRKGRKPKRTK